MTQTADELRVKPFFVLTFACEKCGKIRVGGESGMNVTSLTCEGAGLQCDRAIAAAEARV